LNISELTPASQGLGSKPPGWREKRPFVRAWAGYLAGLDLRHYGGSSTVAKAVGFVLSEHASKTGYCFLSQETLEARVGKSRTSVWRGVKILEREGLLYKLPTRPRWRAELGGVEGSGPTSYWLVAPVFHGCNAEQGKSSLGEGVWVLPVPRFGVSPVERQEEQYPCTGCLWQERAPAALREAELVHCACKRCDDELAAREAVARAVP
jgi:helix-turn-helix protein